MWRAPARVNTSSLLHGGLLVVVSFMFGVLVFVSVVTAGVLLVDGVRESGSGVPAWLSAIGLVATAVTIGPVVRWLHRQTADLVYGQHDDPYAVISEVNELLLDMGHPALTLPSVAAVIADRLHLPYVALETAEPAAVFEHGRTPERAVRSGLPITYLGKPYGDLVASGRGPGRRISGSDIALLGDLARQVGIALHAHQLTHDLQNARERLVLAREEERRRIRNDLHDGLAPTLSSLQLQLAGMRNLISADPERAEAIAGELKDDLKRATMDIRRLVYDLRPPMLDELGLVAALRNLMPPGSGVQHEVEAPEALPRISAAVEVALFRIASEALQNVVKHSGSGACVTRIEADADYITLTVTDDGPAPSRVASAAHGSPAQSRFASTAPDAPLQPSDGGRLAEPPFTAGIGLVSMRERAAELGGTLSIESTETGGTRVLARLPLIPLQNAS